MSVENKIRPLGPKDIDNVTQLFIDTFACPPWNEKWDFEKSRKRIADIFATPGFVGFALHSPSGRALAMGIGCFEQWLDCKHFQIRELCVHPDYHHQGLGTLIVDALKKAAGEGGAKHIYLLTQRQSPAEALYAKQGFAETQDMLIMGLALQPNPQA